MKKMVFLMLALMVLGAANGNAQVRIGGADTEVPTAGTVLDLNNTNGYKGGLLVPNVKLTTLTAVTDLTSPGDAAGLKGLLVYNTNASLLGGAGLFVWDGQKWNSAAFVSSEYAAPLPAGVAVSMPGARYFDVRETLLTSSPYTLTVTGVKSVDKITWAVEDAKGVLSGSPVVSTTTVTDDTETLPLKTAPDVLALANANGGTVSVKVTAYVDFTLANNSTSKTSFSAILQFKNQDWCGTLTDLEGNSYLSARFGAAGCWMTENLKSTYNDILPFGALTEANNPSTDYTKKYYFYPNNTSVNKDAYGLLYTWAAASNRTGVTTAAEGNLSTQAAFQGICPGGWHLPSDYEWSQLEEQIALDTEQKYSTTDAVAWPATGYTATGARGTYAPKLKSVTPVTATATAGTSNTSDDNGFAAYLSGYLTNAGGIGAYGTRIQYWSSSHSATANAFDRYWVYNNTGVYRQATSKSQLEAVRCKLDE
jgi:uncharacterized protein (TIGR02145 family)